MATTRGVIIAERIPLTIQTDLLPASCEIAARNALTGAIQSAILDKQYYINVYDSTLQTLEVQQRYAPFTPLNMAAITLRAMGVQWQTIRKALTPPEAEPPALDERLGNLVFAGRAVGDCYRRGLLRVYAIEQLQPETAAGQGPDIFDVRTLMQSSVRTAFMSFSKGQGRKGRAVPRTLQQLQSRYAATEPNLLSMLTKTVALSWQTKDADKMIRYFHGREPSLESEGNEADETMRHLHSRSYIAERHRRRQVTLDSLQKALDIRQRTGELTVSWKDAEFNFRLPPELSDNEKTSIFLRTFGVRGGELTDMGFKQKEIADNYAAAKRKMGLTQEVNPTLFLLAKKLLTHTGAACLDDVPHTSNLRHLVDLLDSSSKRNINLTNNALHYLYQQIGVANKQEAILALATNGLIPDGHYQNLPVKSPRKTENARHYPFMHAPGYDWKRSDFADYPAAEERFETQFSGFLQTCTSKSFTVTWRGAKIAFDGGTELSEVTTRLMALYAFMAPYSYEAKSILGRNGGGYAAGMREAQSYFGLSSLHFFRSLGIRALFQKGHIANVDSSCYQSVRPILSPEGVTMMQLMARHSLSEIRDILELPPHIIRRQRNELLQLFEVTSMPRLIWSGILQNHIDPNVAE